MKKYVVNSIINSRYISGKEFKPNDQALKYIDKLCSRYDLQVEEIVHQNNQETYIVDYYNQFSITEMGC